MMGRHGALVEGNSLRIVEGVRWMDAPLRSSRRAAVFGTNPAGRWKRPPCLWVLGFDLLV